MDKPRKVALIDLDGTLVQYEQAMADALRKVSDPSEDVIADMEAAGHGRGAAHIKARERMVKNQQGFWRNLPRLELGFEVLHEIEQVGFDLHILTKGPPHAHNAWSEKYSWCREHVPQAKVTITEDKSLVYGTVLFDDWTPYVTSWLRYHPHGLVVMLEHLYNRDFHHDQVVKVRSSSDFTELRERLQDAYSR